MKEANPSSGKGSQVLLVACSAAVLAGALIFQVMIKPKGQAEGRSTGFDLKMRLPQTLPGWQTKELPLGPN
jgi:hypothetical protein